MKERRGEENKKTPPKRVFLLVGYIEKSMTLFSFLLKFFVDVKAQH